MNHFTKNLKQREETMTDYDIKTVLISAIMCGIATIAYYSVVPRVCEVRHTTMECGK